jgi:hypothetical protein
MRVLLTILPESSWKAIGSGRRKIHSAVFKAVNERPWIKGIWLAPYNFNDGIERIDADTRGKPTDELAAARPRKISQKGFRRKR